MAKDRKVRALNWEGETAGKDIGAGVKITEQIVMGYMASRQFDMRIVRKTATHEIPPEPRSHDDGVKHWLILLRNAARGISEAIMAYN